MFSLKYSRNVNIHKNTHTFLKTSSATVNTFINHLYSHWIKTTRMAELGIGTRQSVQYLSLSARWVWETASVSTRTRTCRAAVSRKRPSIACRWSFAAVETTTSRTGSRSSGSITDTWTSPPKTWRSEWMARRGRLKVKGTRNCEREWAALIRRADRESEEWINSRDKSTSVLKGQAVY